MGFLASVLESLPVVATSGYAFTAYATTVAAYAFIAWRVARSKNLLAHIEKLPEEDRLTAVQIEMDTVLPKNISAEQWIKTRTHRYYFQAFIVTCATAVAIIALVILNATGTLDISADVYTGDSLPAEQKTSSTEGAATFFDTAPEEPASADFRVTYEYLKRDSKTEIEPVSTYLTKLAKGEYVQGVQFWHSPFDWEFPILSVKVQNNSDRVVLLSEIIFNVKTSVVNMDPVLVVRAPGYFGRSQILNEGWGKAIDPQLQFSTNQPEQCGKVATTVLPHQMEMKSFDLDTSFDITPFVSEGLRTSLRNCTQDVSMLCLGGHCVFEMGDNDRVCLDKDNQNTFCERPSKPPPDSLVKEMKDEFEESFIGLSKEEFEAQVAAGRQGGEELQSEEATQALMDVRSFITTGRIPDPRYVRVCRNLPACVTGVLGYKTEEGRPKELRFATVVYLGEPGAGVPAPPSYQYDVFLVAGKSEYEQRQAIAQQIKPGETDHFLVRVGSNKSASFDLDVTLADASGKYVWRRSVVLSMFVPRSASRDAEQASTLLATHDVRTHVIEIGIDQ